MRDDDHVGHGVMHACINVLLLSCFFLGGEGLMIRPEWTDCLRD